MPTAAPLMAAMIGVHGAGDSAFFSVQGALGEPDVEVGAELFEFRLLLGELKLVPGFPKGDNLLVGREIEDTGVALDHPHGKRGDIIALVAVFRRLHALRSGHEGLTELVHLGAAVVDVELCAHGGPGRAQDAGERIADRGPAGVPEMEWTRRIGADELEVDALAGPGFVGPVDITGAYDLSRE
jgi:hypothetical protein